MKLVVGICSGGTIRTETMMSLIANIYNLGTHDLAVNILAQIGGYVAFNRNKLVEEAINAEATHLMFLDADMMFDNDAMWTLLQHADKDIVAGNYNIRRDPKSVSGSGSTVKMMVNDEIVSLTELPKGGIFQCYAAPTGFMLINLEVFKKLKKPYFVEWEDKEGNHTTEDVDFCIKANKAGLEVWCDPTIKIGHIGSTAY